MRSLIIFAIAALGVLLAFESTSQAQSIVSRGRNVQRQRFPQSGFFGNSFGRGFGFGGGLGFNRGFSPGFSRGFAPVYRQRPIVVQQFAPAYGYQQQQVFQQPVFQQPIYQQQVFQQPVYQQQVFRQRQFAPDYCPPAQQFAPQDQGCVQIQQQFAPGYAPQRQRQFQPMQYVPY